jgi:4-hydroxy-tetrahydrodipicolinate synthase
LQEKKGIGMLALQANDLEGAFVALITPMTAKHEVDFEKLTLLVNQLVKAGVAGVVPCGTTGQSATLTWKEHVQISQEVVNIVNGRCKTIIATGSNNTQEAVAASNAVEEALGPVTMLHVTGYYNCPPQAGLYKHYIHLVENLKYPESTVVVYNVPSRTACNIEAKTILRLAEHPQIIGVKEVASLEQAVEVATQTDRNSFRVLSGEDDLIAGMMEQGATGTISGSANLAPKLFVDLCELALKGDYAAAATVQARLAPLIRYVFCERNPIPLAHAFSTHLRLPLCPIEGVDSNFTALMELYSPKELGIDPKSFR